MDQDNRWIVEHFEELVNKYGGLYIAIRNGRIISTGDDPKKVENEAMSTYIDKKPSILRVPKEEDIVCLL